MKTKTAISDWLRSNVLGLVAIFIALSGTAYAVDGPLPGQDQVGSGDIINGEVQTADIRDANVTTADIRADAVTTGKIGDGEVQSSDVLNESLTGDDIQESSLVGVDADTFDGEGTASFLRYNSTIPSGVTIKGAFGAQDKDSDTDQGGAPAPLPEARSIVSFPLPAPADLTDTQVNFDDGVSSAIFASDDDPACTGSTDVPTAPAGKVCLYAEEGSGTNNTAQGFAVGSGGSTRFGFGFKIPSTTATARITGTWAYTAP